MVMRNTFRTISLLFLLGTSPSVWAVPDQTMSITPTCTSGTTITCADNTSRMNNVSTPYNAHTHNDLTKTTANTYTIGNSLTGDKALAISNSFTTGPSIRYRQTTERWQASNDASTFFDIPLVANTTAGQLIRATGATWGTTTATYPATAGTASTILRSDGTNFVNSTPTFPNAATVNNALLGDGTNYVNTAVPNCTDASGNHLNYTTATNVFSCGTTSSSAAYTYVSRDGTFTRDVSLTTNLTVTTTGVNPTRCDFTMTNNSPNTMLSYGRSTSVPSNGQGTFGVAGGTAGNFDEVAGLWTFTASAGNYTTMNMSSYGTAQFTVSFVKTATPTGTAFVSWRCEN